MNRPFIPSSKLAHIVFPAEEKRRRVINVATCDELTGHRTRPDRPLGEDISLFLEWLFSKAKLDARMYRAESLGRRMAACLRALRANSPAQARAVLERNPALLDTAINAMLVGVTWFFRDPPVFQTLRSELPLLAGHRGSLYVWSIGCSDGAELYSIGVLLAELNLLDRSYLLGSDCRSDSIRRARDGCFELSELKDVAPDLLKRYFERAQGRYRICKAIRSCAQWRVADIVQSHEPGVWDLILFRNTAMYLRAEATDTIWPRLEQSIRPGGMLVLGKAERPAGAHRLSFMAPCLYRRQRRVAC